MTSSRSAKKTSRTSSAARKKAHKSASARPMRGKRFSPSPVAKRASSAAATKRKSAAKPKIKSHGQPLFALGENFIQLAGERWPLERDVLFRPDRLKYVRKLLPDLGCVFCKCAGTEPSLETLCVFQTQHAMVVLNKYPYNSGHALVLPRRHVAELSAMAEDEYQDVMALLRLTTDAIQLAYDPAGFNLGMNHGRVSGAGIPDHLHWHVVPRWAGDLNFFPLIAETKAVIENLETSFDRLRLSFQNIQAKKIKK